VREVFIINCLSLSNLITFLVVVGVACKRRYEDLELLSDAGYNPHLINPLLLIFEIDFDFNFNKKKLDWKVVCDYIWL